MNPSPTVKYVNSNLDIKNYTLLTTQEFTRIEAKYIMQSCCDATKSMRHKIEPPTHKESSQFQNFTNRLDNKLDNFP